MIAINEMQKCNENFVLMHNSVARSGTDVNIESKLGGNESKWTV